MNKVILNGVDLKIEDVVNVARNGYEVEIDKECMAHIAEVLVRIGDDMNGTGAVACAGITADKLTDGGKISPAGAAISLTPDDLARIERILRQQPPSTDPIGLIADEDYAGLQEP